MKTNNKNELYAVVARRWGEHDTHAYLAGIFTKKHAAISRANEECDERGGKYALIVYASIDGGQEMKEIYRAKSIKG